MKALGDKAGVAGTVANIGDVYKGVGEDVEALDYCERGFEWAGGIGVSSQAEVVASDAVPQIHEVLEAECHVRDRPRPGRHDVQQHCVGVPAVKGRDHDLDALFVLPPIGLDPQISRQSPVDAALGLSDLLGTGRVEAFGAHHVDELNAGRRRAKRAKSRRCTGIRTGGLSPWAEPPSAPVRALISLLARRAS